MSELKQGNITNLPSRTPASTTLNVLSEGAKKFDMVLANLRHAFANIGRRVVQNLVQISRDDARYRVLAVGTLGGEDGQKVTQILQGSVHDIEEMYGISVTATSSQVNKEVEKQSLTALGQFTAQQYPQLLQYAQMMAQLNGDPTILNETVTAAYSGGLEMLTRLVEAFDIQNPEDWLPRTGGGAAPGGAPGAPAPAPGGEAAGPAGGPQGAGPFAQGEDILGSLLGV